MGAYHNLARLCGLLNNDTRVYRLESLPESAEDTPRLRL